MEQPTTPPTSADETTGNPTAVNLEGLSLEGDTLAQVQELIRNAEAEGYLRGRNEKIEATQHFDHNDEPEPEPVRFPTFARRSVWDAE